MSNPPKRALVTGALGFAGRHLMSLLESEGWSAAGVDVDDCDVRDPGAVRGAVGRVRPHAVFHLAGIAAPGDAARNPALAWAVNAEGARNVLAASAAQAEPPAVLIVGSSYALYGNRDLGAAALDESLPLAPADAYAATKAAAELCARDWAERGLRVVIARPFNHIGPGQRDDFAVASFALQIARIESSGGAGRLSVGNLDARRDLSDVRDVVRAYLALIERGRGGQAYHVCSGAARSMREALDGLLAHSTARIEVVFDPARARRDEQPVIVGDANLIFRHTGWKAEIPFSETLRAILDDARRRVAAPEGSAFA